MKEVTLNLNQNKIAQQLLFGIEGRDDFYPRVENECDDWLPLAKNYWQKLYDQHKLFLDDNFVNQFSMDCFSRLWELTQIHFLSEHVSKGIKLIKTSEPYFCFELQNKKFYLEAVCADTEGFEKNLSEAIKLKSNKIEKEVGLIIAVSTAKLPFKNQMKDIHLFLSDHSSSHVSAVIISHLAHTFFPGIEEFDKCCHWRNCDNDYTLVHNPRAITPLPRNFFNVANEVI